MEKVTKNKLFFEALQYLIGERGFSQTALGEKAGVSRVVINQILNHKREAGMATQAKIAQALGYGDLLDFLALGRSIIQGTGEAPEWREQRETQYLAERDRRIRDLEKHINDLKEAQRKALALLRAGQRKLIAEKERLLAARQDEVDFLRQEIGRRQSQEGFAEDGEELKIKSARWQGERQKK